MTYYKIKNLTANLPKRHLHKDETLNIEYKFGFTKKTYNLKPNVTIYVSAPSLPISLHKLRMQSLVSIVEISENSFLKLQNPTKNNSETKIIEKKPKQPITTTTTTKKKTTKKRSYNKKEDSSLIIKEEEENMDL